MNFRYRWANIDVTPQLRILLKFCNILSILIFGIAYTCNIGLSVGNYFNVDKRLFIVAMHEVACNICLANNSISKIHSFIEVPFFIYIELIYSIAYGKRVVP